MLVNVFHELINDFQCFICNIILHYFFIKRTSIFISPQQYEDSSVIFHVESHPDFPQFLQCVTFNFFPTDSHKVAYNLFCLATLYGVPLLIIVICYSQILFAMSKRSRDNENDVSKKERFRGRMRLRRSDITHVERARARTLKMTVIIVLTFFWCWTPYVVMSLWYLFDPVSADKVDSRIQSSLFMFAVSNSCVNPLVYGSYVLNFKKVLKQCLCCCCFRRQQHFDQSLTTATCRSQVRDPSGHIRPRKACVNLNHNGKGTYPCVLEEQKLSNHDGTTLCKNKYMSSLSTRAGPNSHCSQGHVPSPYHSANF